MVRPLAVFCLLSLICGGCSPKENYKATVRSGIMTLPHVQEIKKLFPDAPTDHFFIEYGFHKDQPTTWNTVVYFDGRYVLTYSIDVWIDFHSHRVTNVASAPTFHLWEARKITVHPGGSVECEYEPPGYLFGEEKWNKIVAARGDFSAAGIQLKTNSPVPGFDEYIQAWREGRVQVE